MLIRFGEDALCISGERRSDALAGYLAHRHERGTVKFARSFLLPSNLDASR
jgi:HSP20 family molecular chaperone IbpA